MIDQFEVASRRYEQIRRKHACQEKAEEVSLWMESNVCAIVEELARRPGFQDQIRWPIRRLSKGSGSPQRSLVEAVDAGLVATAQELVKLARQPEISRELLRLGPHEERLPAGDPKTGLVGLSEVELIGRHPWRDLVNVADFFSVRGDLNLMNREQLLGAGSRHAQIAEFTPFVNPRLRPLGDFVSRGLFVRIEYWESILRRFLVRCQTTHVSSANNKSNPWTALYATRDRLNHDVEQLKEECLTGEAARLRNSCIALFQIYWEYRPLVPLEWLGLFPALRHDSANVRYRIESQMDFSIGEQVAAELVAIAQLHKEEGDTEARIETACRSYPLVVVMGVGKRAVYWRGNLLQVDWMAQNALWEMLTVLVERGKGGQGVDVFEMNDRGATDLKDRRHRLKEILPRDLNDKIQPAGRGTYRLSLKPEEICLLRYAAMDQLEEVQGGTLVRR